jgi:hypothetical protein
LFDRLPASIQRQAREAYRLWRLDPTYPGLEFKKIHHRSRSIYSVRIGIGWRALGVVEDNRISWFWIGSHADYDQMLKRR